MSPIAFKIGSFAVYWYGIAYLITFVISLHLAKYCIKFQKSSQQPAPLKTDLKKADLDKLLNYIIFGVILGGRIGEFIFYKHQLFTRQIFFIRNGGMSFHGGVVGVVLAILLFAQIKKKDKFQIADLVTLCTPIGSFLGRLANYVNHEVIGRTTEFLNLGRHPVVFYEAFFEGPILFFILFRRKNLEKIGLSTSLFLFFYGLFRFVLEYFRIPDGILGPITTAQFLSILMMCAGCAIYYKKIFKKS